MSRVLVTGAAGFLGQRLIRALLAAPSLRGTPLREIVLTDLNDPIGPALSDALKSARPDLKITTRQGDLADSAFVQSLVDGGFDSLFHLASLLTLQAEKDPNHAYQVNVEALRHLIDSAQNCPTVIFASSIAIHGGALPPEVGDAQNPTPATTYGTHKAINELLVADYSRLGRIDGRCLRLPIVLTRPGAPLPAVSDMIAGLMREPLGGVDVVAPLSEDTQVPIVSAGAVVAALLRLHEVPVEKLPPKRALNLPSLTVSLKDMAQAVARHGGKGVLSYAPDAAVEAIIQSWPQRFVSPRATELGLVPDTDLTAVIRDYLQNKEA